MTRVAVTITLGIFSVIVQVTAKRNKQVYCGACIGLVQEMDWGLANTDGKKTLQVGSFRIDSDGKQALNTIPLKYSELHLTELLEGACSEVGRYAESQKEGSDKVNYIRTDSRDGQPISLKNIRLSTDTQRLLQFACETIVEEHEDSIIAMYKSQESDVGNKLCVEITGYCHTSNLTEHIWASAEAIMSGIQEAFGGSDAFGIPPEPDGFCSADNITDFQQAMEDMISEAALEEAERQKAALKSKAVSEDDGEEENTEEDGSHEENENKNKHEDGEDDTKETKEEL